MRWGLRLGQPTTRVLDECLTRARGGEVTYDHVGSTLRGGSQGRRTCHEQQILLGRGRPVFDSAVSGLRAWVCHQGIGATIHPCDVEVRPGESLLVILRVGPVRIVVPDRIVEVIDEPDRFGFAYGTLPGHHEQGEEAFIVEHRPDGNVRARVRVDAVPATIAARAGGPAVAMFQRLAAHRYLGALADFTSRENP